MDWVDSRAGRGREVKDVRGDGDGPTEGNGNDLGVRVGIQTERRTEDVREQNGDGVVISGSDLHGQLNTRKTQWCTRQILGPDVCRVESREATEG